MKDSSEPVESSSTRTPSGGRSRRACASVTNTATELRLSFAPGTTRERPMSAMAALAPSESTIPAARSTRLPVSPQSASSSGPRKTP